LTSAGETLLGAAAEVGEKGMAGVEPGPAVALKSTTSDARAARPAAASQRQLAKRTCEAVIPVDLHVLGAST
jgi:hypothetical protein